MLTQTEAKNLLVFLSRVNLNGNEAIEFTNIVNKIKTVAENVAPEHEA